MVMKISSHILLNAVFVGVYDDVWYLVNGMASHHLWLIFFRVPRAYRLMTHNPVCWSSEKYLSVIVISALKQLCLRLASEFVIVIISFFPRKPISLFLFINKCVEKPIFSGLSFWYSFKSSKSDGKQCSIHLYISPNETQSGLDSRYFNRYAMVLVHIYQSHGQKWESTHW